MSDEGSSADVIIILVILALVILLPLTIIALSKICCGLISIWDDCRRDKRRRRSSNSSTDSTAKSKASSAYQEKMALVEGHERFAREAGIRLEDYPFIADYAPAVLIPGAHNRRLAPATTEGDIEMQELATPTTDRSEDTTSSLRSQASTSRHSLNEGSVDEERAEEVPLLSAHDATLPAVVILPAVAAATPTVTPPADTITPPPAAATRPADYTVIDMNGLQLDQPPTTTAPAAVSRVPLIPLTVLPPTSPSDNQSTLTSPSAESNSSHSSQSISDESSPSPQDSSPTEEAQPWTVSPAPVDGPVYTMKQHSVHPVEHSSSRDGSVTSDVQSSSTEESQSDTNESSSADEESSSSSSQSDNRSVSSSRSSLSTEETKEAAAVVVCAAPSPTDNLVEPATESVLMVKSPIYNDHYPVDTRDVLQQPPVIAKPADVVSSDPPVISDEEPSPILDESTTDHTSLTNEITGHISPTNDNAGHISPTNKQADLPSMSLPNVAPTLLANGPTEQMLAPNKDPVYSSPTNEQPREILSANDIVAPSSPADECIIEATLSTEVAAEPFPDDESTNQFIISSEPAALASADDEQPSETLSSKDVVKLSTNEHAVPTSPANEHTEDISPTIVHAEATSPMLEQTDDTSSANKHAVDTSPADEHTDHTSPANEHAVEIPSANEHAVEAPSANEEAKETTPANEHAVDTSPANAHTDHTSPANEHTVATSPPNEHAVDAPPAPEHAVEAPSANEHAKDTSPANDHTDTQLPPSLKQADMRPDNNCDHAVISSETEDVLQITPVKDVSTNSEQPYLSVAADELVEKPDDLDPKPEVPSVELVAPISDEKLVDVRASTPAPVADGQPAVDSLTDIELPSTLPEPLIAAPGRVYTFPASHTPTEDTAEVAPKVVHLQPKAEQVSTESAIVPSVRSTSHSSPPQHDQSGFEYAVPPPVAEDELSMSDEETPWRKESVADDIFGAVSGAVAGMFSTSSLPVPAQLLPCADADFVSGGDDNSSSALGSHAGVPLLLSDQQPTEKSTPSLFDELAAVSNADHSDASDMSAPSSPHLLSPPAIHPRLAATSHAETPSTTASANQHLAVEEGDPDVSPSSPRLATASMYALTHVSPEHSDEESSAYEPATLLARPRGRWLVSDVVRPNDGTTRVDTSPSGSSSSASPIHSPSADSSSDSDIGSASSASNSDNNAYEE